jgi:membrane protein
MKKKTFNLSEKLLHFSQFLYLTLSNFAANNLWESAAACSFGFVFSFVPVSLIILTILTSIIRIFPEIENYILSYTAQFYSVIDVELALSNITKLQHIHMFDVFLALWVVWMARKLFASIVSAMNRIFRSISNRKTTINQLVSFISEFVLVIVIAVVILSSFLMNKVLKLSFFETMRQLFPRLLSHGSNLLFSSAVYIMLFTLSLYYFRIGSGTKPRFKLCIFYSFLNTLATFLLSQFLNGFLNISNYNVIYGTISTLIILMLKVYFFFVIFLFTAQMIYVSQFFHTLILNQLYLLPEYLEKSFFSNLRRILFINPVSDETYQNTIYYEGSDVIYLPQENADSVYFICKGFVSIENEETKKSELINQGSFIGENACILNKKRGEKALAFTQCKLIKISKEDFLSILHANPKAASKAMKNLSVSL